MRKAAGIKESQGAGKAREELIELRMRVKMEESKLEVNKHNLNCKDEEEKSEEDDEDIDEAEINLSAIKKGVRASVTAEAFGDYNKQNEEVTYVEKEESEKELLRSVILNSFVFGSVHNDKEGVEKLVMAFVKNPHNEGDLIIKQGDDGKELYLVEEGTLDCFKTNEANEET